ncbi:hypothetical protein ICE98_00126 [Lactococcus lactis]|nr:hypothetical protein [Lactococcus lactis]
MPIIPKNNEEKNKKVVCTLNDLEKRKVVEHNALIQSVAKMQKTALKMFELAVSCIDTENLPENNTVYLSKKELFSFFKYRLVVSIVNSKKPLNLCRNKPISN